MTRCIPCVEGDCDLCQLPGCSCWCKGSSEPVLRVWIEFTAPELGACALAARNAGLESLFTELWGAGLDYNDDPEVDTWEVRTSIEEWLHLVASLNRLGMSDLADDVADRLERAKMLPAVV